MNFLIISQNAGSKNHGMVIRNYNWAKSLVNQGHKVTIVASAQSHSRHTQPKTSGRVKVEMIEGIEYVWLWGPPYTGNSNLMRVLSMVMFCLQLYLPSKFLKRERDVVVVSSPPPFSVYPAVRLARRLKAKLVYDIRDLWPLTPKLLGGHSEGHPLIRAMQHAECFVLKHADIVTAVPHQSEAYLLGKGMSGGIFYPFRNGICEDAKGQQAHINEEYKQAINNLRKTHPFIIGYAGAIGRANAMDYFVKAIAKTTDKVAAVLIGDGPFEIEVKRQIKALKLEDRIIVLPPIGAHQVHDFLQHIDVAYCGMKKSALYEYGASPTKLNDYMMAQKPVIYAVNEPKNAIELSGAGVSCDAEDADKIAMAIDSMVNMSPDTLRDMGEKGKIWAMDNVLVAKQMDILVQRLKEI